ncbi:MAG: hypothetical protein M1829_000948 [Trizodia sp. TS-e1964]|nr:MAG: hypothetical protein M1829_000948 [Trizodia sp. TS-e1964]
MRSAESYDQQGILVNQEVVRSQVAVQKRKEGLRARPHRPEGAFIIRAHKRGRNNGASEPCCSLLWYRAQLRAEHVAQEHRSVTLCYLRARGARQRLGGMRAVRGDIADRSKVVNKACLKKEATIWVVSYLDDFRDGDVGMLPNEVDRAGLVCDALARPVLGHLPRFLAEFDGVHDFGESGVVL